MANRLLGNGHIEIKLPICPQIGRYPDNMKVGQLIDMMKNIRQAQQHDEELIESFDFIK